MGGEDGHHANAPRRFFALVAFDICLGMKEIVAAFVCSAVESERESLAGDVRWPGSNSTMSLTEHAYESRAWSYKPVDSQPDD